MIQKCVEDSDTGMLKLYFLLYANDTILLSSTSDRLLSKIEVNCTYSFYLFLYLFIQFNEDNTISYTKKYL